MVAARRYFVSGQIDMETAPKLRADLEALVADQRIEVIVIDCSDLVFMDSSGFQVLLTVQRELADQGRQLRIEKLSASLHTIFDTLGLSGILRVTQ